MSLISKWGRKIRKWATWKRFKPPLSKEVQREFRDVISELKDVSEDVLGQTLELISKASLGLIDIDEIEEFYKGTVRKFMEELDEVEDELREWVIQALWSIVLTNIKRELIKRLTPIAEDRPEPLSSD